MTCEIGRFLKALESYGLLQEKLDEYSKEMGEFFPNPIREQKTYGIDQVLRRVPETKDLFNEGVGVSYEECCYNPEGARTERRGSQNVRYCRFDTDSAPTLNTYRKVSWMLS